MTHNIPRHDTSVPGYTISVKDHPDERETEASDIEEYPDSIDLSLKPLDLNAKVSLAVDPDAARLETWEDWVAAMQIYNAMFEVTTNPEGTELELMVNHKSRRTTATGPRYCTNAGNWLAAFCYAVTCREEARWRKLCDIPVELLREAGESDGAQYNPYVYHWVSAIQAYVLNRPGLGEELAAAMELSEPEQVEFGPAETLNKLTFPPMKVFLHLVERDSDGFNAALAQGLELFKSYYTADDERSEDVKGTVPLILLALACLAYDTAEVDPDFRLEVESGYLPKHILQRSWYGEFPV